MSDEKKRRYLKPPNLQDSRKMSDEQWLAERFFPKVQKTDSCWIWMGCIEERGYGRVIYKGKKQKPHRVIKALNSGLALSEIPKKLLACHTCDNRKCVNPDHIFWGSNTDNMRDAAVKRRLAGKGWFGVARKGSKNPARKLSEPQVVEILSMLSSGESNISIARKFKVTESAIRSIKRGDTWREVSEKWKAEAANVG